MANAWIDGRFSATMGDKMCTLRIVDKTYKIGTVKMRELSQWLQIEVNKSSLREHSIESDRDD